MLDPTKEFILYLFVKTRSDFNMCARAISDYILRPLTRGRCSFGIYWLKNITRPNIHSNRLCGSSINGPILEQSITVDKDAVEILSLFGLMVSLFSWVSFTKRRLM